MNPTQEHPKQHWITVDRGPFHQLRHDRHHQSEIAIVVDVLSMSTIILIHLSIAAMLQMTDALMSNYYNYRSLSCCD